MLTVVIAVLVLKLVESSGFQQSTVSCICPMNPYMEITCNINEHIKSQRTLQIKEDRCASNNCSQGQPCCRYSLDGSQVITSIDANGRCYLQESECIKLTTRCNFGNTDSRNCSDGSQVITSVPANGRRCSLQESECIKLTTGCKFANTDSGNCSFTCKPAIIVPPSTTTTAEQPTSATAPDTSSQPTTTSSQSAHTDSTGNAQENQDAEDDAFPVATAVTVPVSIVAVAAIIVAVILRCRCKNTSKGDPDTNTSVMHKGVMGNALVNQSYNKHDISVNLTHASRPADDIAPDDTEYAECGPIDESLKPIGQRVREELGNKPGKKPLNGDPYDHLRQDGRSITRDANYEHLEIEVPDKAYSHINCVGERNDGNMDNGRISDIHTYTHLETNPGAVLVCESSIPIANDQKGKYTGNAYLTLQPESQQTVLRGDCEKVTTDHSPHEYVQLEKGGHCVAETTAEYTYMLGVGNGTSSNYQTLEATIDPVNDRIKLNGSPVIADAEDRTSVSHDYWHLISSAEESNGNLADTGIAEVHTVANTQALGNGMRTECNQAISPDMTKDIRNRQFPGNVYMPLEPEPDQTALKGDYEQATTDYMPHDYMQLDK